MNKDSLFLIVCSCLTVGFVYFFGKARDHFSDSHFLAEELRAEKKHNREKDLELELAYQRLFDFEQTVIAELPEDARKDRDFKLKFRAPAAVHPVDFSGSLLAKGKKLFAAKDLEGAKKIFKEFESKYPQSLNLPEALFLKAESHFLSNEFEDCLATADMMLQHYPQNDSTGFLMIRMGQIFEFRKRDEEAIQVYRTILAQFDNPLLKTQAKKLLAQLEKRE